MRIEAGTEIGPLARRQRPDHDRGRVGRAGLGQGRLGVGRDTL